MSKKSSKTLKIVLVGSAGRMGREITKLAAKDFRISAHVDEGKDWSAVRAAEVDAVIDFSTPSGLEQALDWCVKNKKPLVSGTTGGAINRAKLKKAAQKIPLLYSANMSMGVAALMTMINALVAVQEWDFQIEETHHKNKKDKPSGTAILLQEHLQNVLGRNLAAPHSIRGGGVPGIHEIHAMGPDEALVLQHTAFNRKVFAQGALKAARWLFDNKAPGLYDLSDLYKIRS